MTQSVRPRPSKQWRLSDAHLLGAWGAVLVSFLLSTAWLVFRGPAGAWQWLDCAFVFLVALMSMCSMARRMPVQNVVSAALVILGISSVVIATFAYYASDETRKIGFQNFEPFVLKSNRSNLLPGRLPFLVLALALSSRETARLILRPWRRDKNYGLWLMVLGAGLVTATTLVIEPFANGVAGWWKWLPDSQTAESWHGTPWWAFLCWFLLSLTVYWFAGPWFVVKRPPLVVPDLTPLGVWGLILAYFTIGNVWGNFSAAEIKGKLWTAILAAVIVAVPVAFMAWR
ncbi:MAG: hypothetical protein N3G20_04310, partial [Verrucomicrobiae bacterium]|nr:hypothetical protein [Verrucomicrobiae bacterium]